LGFSVQRASITERIDNITEIRDEYLSELPPCPKSVKIELTGHCNFSCAFCARTKRLRMVGQINRGLYERILVDLLEAGVEELGLFYLGESFLVPWLPDAVSYAKDLGFPYVFLTTNGSHCTPAKVEACMAAGLDSLKFSFNYSDPEHFASITKKPEATYFEIVSNLKQAWRVREEGGYTCGLYASYIMFEGERQLKKWPGWSRRSKPLPTRSMPSRSTPRSPISRRKTARGGFFPGATRAGTTECGRRFPAGSSLPKAM
jgi:hypothetical protein